jgi:hypothetical protein
MAENSADESISSRSCDRCGSWSAVGVEYYEQYRVPDDFERLCRDCAKETNIHSAEEMSDEELIAAIMDDSIGYASPTHAEKHVADFRDGGTEAYCERGAAVYGRDLEALIESARAHWLRIKQGNPEKAEQLLETVEQWREVEEQEGPMASMGISALYPTHAPTGGGDGE